MPEEKAIARLKVTREMLNGFLSLIKILNSASKKYGIPITEIQSDKDFMGKALVDTLPPEKLGLLIKALIGTAGLQHGLTNFMSYDRYQLDELATKLKSTLEAFDAVLEGL